MEALSLALCAIGLVLIIIEVIMPGILIGLLGGAVLAAGIVFGFQANTTLGLGELVGSGVVVPLLVWWALRRLRLKVELTNEPPKEDLSKLVGAEGEVVTDLRPSGTVRIDGKKYLANTFGEYLEAKERIKVVKVEGKRVFVKAE